MRKRQQEAIYKKVLLSVVVIYIIAYINQKATYFRLGEDFGGFLVYSYLVGAIVRRFQNYITTLFRIQ